MLRNHPGFPRQLHQRLLVNRQNASTRPDGGPGGRRCIWPKVALFVREVAGALSEPFNAKFKSWNSSLCVEPEFLYRIGRVHRQEEVVIRELSCRMLTLYSVYLCSGPIMVLFISNAETLLVAPTTSELPIFGHSLDLRASTRLIGQLLHV